MAVKPNTPAAAVDDTDHLGVDASQIEGFNVVTAKGRFLGTYPTEEDAQAYIDGHLTPQDIEASIVEGHAPAPEAAE